MIKISFLTAPVPSPNSRLELEEFELETEKISEPLKILHLSDLHFTRWGRLEDKLLAEVAGLEFDLMVMTGDYIDNMRNFGKFRTFLQQLSRQVPAFAVPGNHDYRYDLDKIGRALSGAGIRLLRNEQVELKVSGSLINIVGVGCPRMDRHRFAHACAPERSGKGFNLVLSHTYQVIEQIEEMARVHPLSEQELVLAGDTHGRQVDLPVVRFFFDLIYQEDYVAGLFELESENIGHIYVNRGLGVSAVPLRINCPPEMTMIELKPGITAD